MAIGGGGVNDKMASRSGRARHNIPGSEVMHKFESQSLTFQEEALFNEMPFNINIRFKIFFSSKHKIIL